MLDIPALRLSRRQQQVVAAVVLAGGVGSLRALRSSLAAALAEQRDICRAAGLEPRSRRSSHSHSTGGGGGGGGIGDGGDATKKSASAAAVTRRITRPGRSPRVAVDAIFARRLVQCLRICVPSPLSPEAGLIYAQTALLVARTWLTDVSSQIEGGVGRYIIARDAPRLRRLMLLFCAVAAPAAVVNSALKYLQKLIKLSFMRRLTLHLHERYCSHRAYYAASWLGGLSGADQRLTEDVEKFSFAISDLYAYTFKPLLDVILFTRSLSRLMGYKSQAMLYGYYIACSGILRLAAPPLAQMTAQEAALSGAFRQAHQRLSAHAEEVAFNDPPAGMAEQLILNQHLFRLLRHSRLSAAQTFVQGIIDSALVKYGATVIALAVYAAHAFGPGASDAGDATANYIRAMRLLSNSSRGVGDLVLVYKRVTALAGHTSRVAELLEQVGALGGTSSARVHTNLFLRNVSSSGTLAPPAAPDGSLLPPPEPRRTEGDVVAFDRVYLSSPDGTPLVRELSFEVRPGSSVLIMGANGSGKSSLFRVAAGLWPLQAGGVTLPPKGDLFYLSQRPYMVAGTLRDQLLYPEPPRAVFATASDRARARIAPWMLSQEMTEEELEERLCACLEAVELDYLLGRGAGWNQVQDWEASLSGGEKQRLAAARLLFHRPKYAILDEATSAVSADGEEVLYLAIVRAGITMLSIGHRKALRKYHSSVLHFEGQGVGKGWHIEKLRDRDVDGLSDEDAYGDAAENLGNLDYHAG